MENKSSVRYTEQEGAANLPARRINQAFTLARAEGRCVLIPYFMCGYPTARQSIAAVLAAAESGADLIELGIPFSDPLADGATIQHAGHVALEGGMTVAGCLEIARQVAERSTTPLILMGYYNPLLAYGLERFCAEAAAAGVCGLIVPDLPPEEATPLQEQARLYGLALIFLIPPTTPEERIAAIIETAAAGPRGFIYCVSLSGVTGERATLPPHLQSFIERVRRYAAPYELPLVVGFGLSRPEHIAEVAHYADGAVIGSALVSLLDRHAEGEQASAVSAYVRALSQRARGVSAS
jgi:tryptophan synthase alpha chain